MAQIANVRAINRRALLAFTAVLATLVILVAAAVAALQRERLESAEREYLRGEMRLLGELATDALLRSDYVAVQGLVQRWFDRHDDLNSIRAVMSNDFALVERRRAAPAQTPLTVSHGVEFEGRLLMTLHAVGDFTEKQRGFAYIAAQVAALSVALVLLLSWALWFTLKRTALRPLEKEIDRREQKERELLTAKEEAEHANRAKSEFLSRMSHELRTPLNAILGFAQILRMKGEATPAPQREQFMAQIEKAGWHLLELISEVLDLSRIETGRMGVSREPVDLQRLCAECVQLVQPLANASAITVVDKTGQIEPLYAFADRTRLNQVLTNLLSNAVKYNRRGGMVTLSLQAAGGDWIELSVTDTGHGFTDKQRQNLFQPFNRLGAENGTVEGTGIGLVITKALTELMGGTIQLTTKEGEGSCFTLRLVRAKTGMDSAPEAQATVPALAS